MRQRLTSLFRSLSIYGLGDAATSLVNLLLLPIYTNYLTRQDYGIVTMLLTIEAVAKVVFRWGIDTAFMRLYYDCRDDAARQRLASTIFFFLLVANGLLVAVSLAAAGWLSDQLFGSTRQAILVALVIANTFVAGFYFLPYQVLRIADKSAMFMSLTFVRSAGTVVARLGLVVAAGWGVAGVVYADVLVTTLFTVVLFPWFARLIRPMFSRTVIREALGFGLPRIPHSLAHQVMSLADRYFLNLYRPLEDVGLYGIGATFGLALKLFLSALEFAWTPFYLGVMREPDAKRIYSTVSTYVFATLVLLGMGLCAVARDLVRLFTAPAFHDAAAVTPWITLAVMFQGVNLIFSIGLIITKRTTRYPLATGLAAAVGVVANAVLIRRYGVMGAAWATVLAYATLAAITVGFSWKAYPVRYEWSRLLRIVMAGFAGYAAGHWLVPSSLPAALGLILRGGIAAGLYLGMLHVTGFFHPGEIRILRELRVRVTPGPRVATPPPDPGGVEMAGEIVGMTPEPDAAALELDEGTTPRDGAQPTSRPPRR